MLVPEEHFCILGMPAEKLSSCLEGLTDNAKRKRAGEAMALPSLAVAAAALLAAMGIGTAS